MKLEGIRGRVDHLERKLGNPDEDERRLLEGFNAVVEGRVMPHAMTPGMRQLIARALLEINVDEDLPKSVESMRS